MKGPLDSIRVLDFTRVLAGPYCTMILGDMGAEVIKIEKPGTGDDSRDFGPPFVGEFSSFFLSVNRNKKSMCINLKDPRGVKIVRELVKLSDVVVENFRPGTMKKLELDYERLKKINPRLIYASISGFGQDGPWREKAGYDVLIQGLSGLMSLNGEPNKVPYKVGVSIADLAAGMNAVQGILAALYFREKTGKGQRVDVSLFDSVLSLLTFQAGIYFATGKSPKRMGNRHPNICPYETFPSADDHFILAVGNDKIWKKFCKVVNPELDDDPRFTANSLRVKNRDQLRRILAAIFRQKPAKYWLELFEKNNIPSSSICNVEEAFSFDQVKARDMIQNVNLPSIGQIEFSGIPVKLDQSPGNVRFPPPVLGGHTSEILLEILSYKKEKIDEYCDEGVIQV